jgi:hypothetical protein
MLRLAFELAFSTASLHAGIYCPPLSMDDIAFFHPVPIGCIVQFLVSRLPPPIDLATAEPGSVSRGRPYACTHHHYNGCRAMVHLTIPHPWNPRWSPAATGRQCLCSRPVGVDGRRAPGCCCGCSGPDRGRSGKCHEAVHVCVSPRILCLSPFHLIG